MNKSPTAKQIQLADNIAKVLNIDFPFSSKQFTKYQYSKFISTHIEEYREIVDNTIFDEDMCAEICVNDVWCEYY